MGSLRNEGRPVQRYEVVPASRRRRSRNSEGGHLRIDARRRASNGSPDERLTTVLDHSSALQEPRSRMRPSLLGKAHAVDRPSLTSRYVRQLVLSYLRRSTPHRARARVDATYYHLLR